MKKLMFLVLFTFSCAHGGSDILDRLGVPQARWDRECDVVKCSTTGAGSVEIFVENGPAACNWTCVYYSGSFRHVRAEFMVNPAGCFEEPVIYTSVCH